MSLLVNSTPDSIPVQSRFNPGSDPTSGSRQGQVAQVFGVPKRYGASERMRRVND
jgi:hypothetical protein